METNLIETRLKSIEKMLLSQKEVLTLTEFCEYAGISKSYGYKLTSENRVPHYKPSGKMVYFKKTEIDKWLLQNRVKTDADIEKLATDTVLNNKKGGVK